MLWVVLILLIVGLGLVVIGVIPRRIGDEPRCLGCDFDLSGLCLMEPDSVCPECATNLSDQRSIRSGRSVRRRSLILLGVILLLPMLTLLVAGSSWTAWNSSKPVAILVLDGRFGSNEVARAAVEELNDRFVANTLTTAEQETYAALLADRIATRTTIDLHASNDLVLMRQRGILAEDDWQRVTARLTAIAADWAQEFEYSDRYTLIRDKHGRILGEEFFPVPPRTANLPSAAVGFVYSLQEARVDGEPIGLVDYGTWRHRLHPGYGWDEIPRPRYKAQQESLSSSGRMLYEGGVPDPVLGVVEEDAVTKEWESLPAPQHMPWLGTLEPGQHAFETTWRVEIYAIDLQIKARQTGLSTSDLDLALPMGVHTVKTSGTLTINESGANTITVVRQPAELENVRKGIAFYDSTSGITIDGKPPGLPVQEPGASPTRWLYVAANSTSWLRVISTDDSAAKTQFSGASGVALFGNLHIEIAGKRLEQAPWPVHLRPNQGLNTLTGFDDRFVRIEIPMDATHFDVVFVPDLDRAASAAGPWLSEQCTPMPTAAAEIRWESIEIEPLPEAAIQTEAEADAG